MNTISTAGAITSGLAAIVAAGAIVLFSLPARADCTLAGVGVPLPDLGSGTHGPAQGGLYPDGAAARPQWWTDAALDVVQSKIAPRAPDGTEDPTGSVVMISVGMSNTTQEFAGGFLPRLAADGSLADSLVVVDGAQGGQDVSSWANANGQVWMALDQRLQQAGVTGNQVQVAWMKQAAGGAANDFPGHAEALQAGLEDVARNLRARYPNLRLLYVSSRTRAFSDGMGGESSLNPEPQAYESGFSVKWLIENQMGGEATLAWEGDTDPAPLVLWGPYLWADGEAPRSDGFTWACDDTGPDLTHPSNSGVDKVGLQLHAFFKTDPTATPWFLDDAGGESPPTCAPTATPDAGDADVEVQLAANAADPDGTVVEHYWTFGDGTFASGPDVTKRFPVEGAYEAFLTVTDDQGNASTCSVQIDVGDVGSGDSGDSDGGDDGSDSGDGSDGADDTGSGGDDAAGSGGSDVGDVGDSQADDGPAGGSSGDTDPGGGGADEDSGCSCNQGPGSPIGAAIFVLFGLSAGVVRPRARRSTK